nr:MAG TPA: hypothetical protein [Caudoviricetes sp.]
MAAKWQPSGDALSPIESTPAGKTCRGAFIKVHGFLQGSGTVDWEKNGRRKRPCR